MDIWLKSCESKTDEPADGKRIFDPLKERKRRMDLRLGIFRGAKAKPSRLHKACFATEMGAVGRRNNARGRQPPDYKPIAKTCENGVFGDQWEVEQKNSVD